MDDQERRRDTRMRISLPTARIRYGQPESVEMVDASYRGLFVIMHEPPPVRELVKLQVELPSGPLELHAVVVRIVEDHLGRPGVGLRFFALDGQPRATWEQFIRSALSSPRSARAA